MTFAEKQSLIDAFEHAYEPIEALIAPMSAAEIAFLPPIDDAWSINEHLVHLLDADCNLVYRARGATGEPGITVPIWDQEGWRSKLHYEKMDGRSCLQTAKAVRSFIAAGLRALSDAEWEASGIVHPARGPMTLQSVIELYRDHAGAHIPYIQRNHAAFIA